MRGLNPARVYDALYEEEDARVCTDISDEACSNVPGNFFLNAFTTALGQIAEAVTNAKTTLPWLLNAVGAPGWTIAVLVPIRESGSMLPQLAIGHWVRGFAIRKWFYTAGAIAQAIALLATAWCVTSLTGTAAGVSVLLCLTLFALARGFCSVASKDVTGKTVPKSRRGRASGLASTVAGVGTLLIVLLMFTLEASVATYTWLIVGGAGCWLVAGGLQAMVREDPGASEGGRNGLQEALQRMSLLYDDRDFRNFVIGRALLMGSGLSAPFLVLLAGQRADSGLLVFLLAQAIAAIISGQIWGFLADRSSRKLMLATACGTGLLIALVIVADLAFNRLTHSAWFLPGCFFVLAILHEGVRTGRKTYLVDLSGGNKRTDYVAVSNTVIGLLLLVAGIATSALQALSTMLALLVFACAAFAAVAVIWRTPEVSN